MLNPNIIFRQNEHFTIKMRKGATEEQLDWNDYKSMRFTRAVLSFKCHLINTPYDVPPALFLSSHYKFVIPFFTNTYPTI